MITQSEADALFVMLKKTKSSNPLAFPHAVGELLAEFVSVDGRKAFLLSINIGDDSKL